MSRRLPRHEYQEMTQKLRTAIRSHMDRTGMGPAALLRGKREEAPKGLDAATVRRWFLPGTRSARKEHVQYVLSQLKTLPDWNETHLPFDAEVREKLRAHIKATGKGVAMLLHKRGDVPKGLSAQVVYRWLAKNSATENVKREHLEYLLRVCDEHIVVLSAMTKTSQKKAERRHSRDRVPIPENFIESLRLELERTNVAPGKVLKRCATAGNLPGCPFGCT